MKNIILALATITSFAGLLLLGFSSFAQQRTLNYDIPYNHSWAKFKTYAVEPGAYIDTIIIRADIRGHGYIATAGFLKNVKAYSKAKFTGVDWEIIRWENEAEGSILFYLKCRVCKTKKFKARLYLDSSLIGGSRFVNYYSLTDSVGYFNE